MTILRVKSQKVDKLGGYIEKAMHYMGKAMQCSESLSEDEDEYNERRGVEEDEDEYNTNERGGYMYRKGRGRSRYGMY